MDMNCVILQGRLAFDPEIHVYQKDEKEIKVAKICIVNQSQMIREDFQPEPLYIYATAFHSAAKYIEKALKKGSRILLHGELRPNNYVKDGKKIYSQQLIIRRVFFDGMNRGRGNSDEQEDKESPLSADIPEEEDIFLSLSTEELSGLPFSDI